MINLSWPEVIFILVEHTIELFLGLERDYRHSTEGVICLITGNLSSINFLFSFPSLTFFLRSDSLINNGEDTPYFTCFKVGLIDDGKTRKI